MSTHSNIVLIVLVLVPLVLVPLLVIIIVIITILSGKGSTLAKTQVQVTRCPSWVYFPSWVWYTLPLIFHVLVILHASWVDSSQELYLHGYALPLIFHVLDILCACRDVPHDISNGEGCPDVHVILIRAV